jgi:hypothetical protein
MVMQLYSLIADSVPEERIDEETLLLLDKGLEDQPEGSEIPLKELHFMTTLLIKSANPESIASEFREWWFENMASKVSLKVLATDQSELSVTRIRDLENMAPESWSFNSSFIAYFAKSNLAYLEALEIISDSDLVRRH